MGVIPNPKMAFIFPISCILALIFPILIKYFPKCVGKGSFPKSQIKSLHVFFIFTQKVIHHFPAPIFSDLMMPGYPHKASYFEYRLCHKVFSGEDRA